MERSPNFGTSRTSGPEVFNISQPSDQSSACAWPDTAARRDLRVWGVHKGPANAELLPGGLTTASTLFSCAWGV